MVPTPPEWRGRAELTGYWFLDRSADWQPPAQLEAFLRDGTPAVYAGFGSMTMKNPDVALDAIVTAVERVDCRAVISAGWAGLQPQRISNCIDATNDMPHDWLFPRMASIVHHGGAGTSAAALRAGRPSVVIPFFSDQPFWGRWLERIGATAKPLPIKRLSADELAKAIDLTLTSRTLREAAEGLGTRIRQEDGVARAAELVEQAALHRAHTPRRPVSIRPAHVEA